MLIDPADASFITRIVTATRALSGVYPVVCRADVALIEKTASPEFIRNTKMYYPSVEVVDDLTALGQLGDVCTRSLFTTRATRRRLVTAELEKASGSGLLAVIPSGEHWVDISEAGE